MKKYITIAIISVCSIMAGQAGNPDRAGGAGATQLLINPFGRSGGVMGANSASLRGVEAMQFNVGGLAYVQKTEIALNQVVYLQGSGVFVNNFSLGQALGNDNVIGLSLTRMDFGNIPVTSETQPDGTLGTYTPQVLNLGFAYAKKFSNSITGGVLIRYITEGLANVRATGVAIDAGVDYQTSLNPKNKIKKEDFRFGISVRNIGPDMGYSGSGLSFRSINPITEADRRAVYATQNFNLPALVHIGVAYDIRLDKMPDIYNHRLTPMGNFNYNAFSNNVTSVGVEYGYKETIMVRGGYAYQANNNETEFRTQYTGPSAGATIQMPVSKKGTMLALDFSYAPTRVFNGIYNISLRFALGNKKS